MPCFKSAALLQLLNTVRELCRMCESLINKLLIKHVHIIFIEINGIN